MDRADLHERAWISLGGVPLLVEPLTSADLELYGRVRRQLSRAVTEIRDALTPQVDGQMLVQRGLEAVRRLVECERAGLWLLNASGRPELARMIGDLQPPPSRGVIDRVLESGRAILCSDTSGAEALASRQSVASGGIRAVVAVPIEHHGRLFGIVYADTPQPGKLFTELDRELLDGIMEQLRLSLISTRLGWSIEALRKADAVPADPDFQRLLADVLPAYGAE